LFRFLNPQLDVSGKLALYEILINIKCVFLRFTVVEHVVLLHSHENCCRATLGVVDEEYILKVGRGDFGGG
jgi:hypothetical protein